MTRRRYLACVAASVGSGFAALVYQIVWAREFRFLFGASTAASGAVLAAFAAGLGAGSLKLGRRADAHADPLTLYAKLESGIAFTAALSPFLLLVVRKIYLAVGGTVALGPVFGTALRLVLAMLVIGAPTFLMGGTLPSLARAVTDTADPQRRRLGVLYGANTLGAVMGSSLSTFFLLENLGTHATLWVACGANLIVALSMILVARREPGLPMAPPASAPAVDAPASVPARRVSSPLVYAAAGATGFVFFLLELVWYRMLGPILGGTIFSFGLILTTALLGMGIGGALYAPLFRRRKAALEIFALTCLAEAFFIALPFALGDDIAVLAVLLRPLGALGFSGFLAGWSVITALVVLLPAITAGLQFPILIALLGEGGDHVGEQTSRAYVFNTMGAVLGSIAGGFGLMPLLSAPGCWRLAVALLVGLSLLLVLREGRRATRVAVAAGCAVTVALLFARGPTAAWRHSPIGAGRVSPQVLGNERAREAFLRDRRNEVVRAFEGFESSVALTSTSGLAFVVNGKVDGHVREDAGTQVFGGLIGGLLHPDPKRALVIGLGTGSTAGWLGKLPSIETVDVFELEPAILEVARASFAVNENVLDNPKVKVRVGDARELLALMKTPYDLIFSEPSNPYRAGIASLYTKEYYAAAKERLSQDGLFLQWVQAYETDTRTIRIIINTLSEVFPEIEVWEMSSNDLLFVAGNSPRKYSAPQMRERASHEPYDRALRVAWQTEGLEGFFAHFVARSSFVKALAKSNSYPINTDDQCVVEFGFAKNLGTDDSFNIEQFLLTARVRKESLPTIEGAFDFDRMRYERGLLVVEPHRRGVRSVGTTLPAEYKERLEAFERWVSGDPVGALRSWSNTPRTALIPLERIMLADSKTRTAAPDARRAIEDLAPTDPTDAAILETLLLVGEGKNNDAVGAYEKALELMRKDPWAELNLVDEIMRVTPILGQGGNVARVQRALAEPLSAYLAEEARRLLRISLLGPGGLSADCATLFTPLEPDAPWQETVLRLRADCYSSLNHPLAGKAARELERFHRQVPPIFGSDLPPP